MAINLDVAAQEIIDIFGIKPMHFNCRCNGDYTYSDEYFFGFDGSIIHTIDVEYEDVTHKKLEP